MHALTEWIPERVAIRPGTVEFDADKEFARLLDRFHKGHCLVTVATGELSEAEAERAGLVVTHAYALLDIRQVKVRLCLFYVLVLHLCIMYSSNNPCNEIHLFPMSNNYWIFLACQQLL